MLIGVLHVTGPGTRPAVFALLVALQEVRPFAADAASQALQVVLVVHGYLLSVKTIGVGFEHTPGRTEEPGSYLLAPVGVGEDAEHVLDGMLLIALRVGALDYAVETSRLHVKGWVKG